MKVSIFTRGHTSHSDKYEKAFADGLIEHQHTVEWHSSNLIPDHTMDLAVIWGINNSKLIGYFKTNQIDYVVLERGYIGDRKKWTSCGFNGLNGHADFCNKNSDDKRIAFTFDYIHPSPVGAGGYMLIMGQVSSDASVKHLGFHKWLDKKYHQLHSDGTLPVFYRPHPLEKEPYIPEGLEVLEGTLEEVIADAETVYVLNSNSGVDAAMMNVPVEASDKGSMVYGLKLADRYQWLKDMSYTQWTLEEMASGETWNHLKKKYEK